MKIGILTQPLATNYGGLLQNYALQKVLKQMGHDAVTIQRKAPSHDLVKFLSVLKRVLLRQFPKRVWPTIAEQTIISQYTGNFIEKYISTTPPLFIECNTNVKKYKFDAYVVGSDQVWRSQYNHKLSQMFLDFALSDSVKRLSYAASFGVDYWEYTDMQTTEFRELIAKFDAVSVREESAIGLCKRYLGLEPVHVLDPTMLLCEADYSKLVEDDKVPLSEGNLMTYILDKTEEKEAIIRKVEICLDLQTFTIMPKSNFEEVGYEKMNECIFPPVTKWIRGFIDAKFIVVDSFHGCVFSLIFEKPFIVIINKERGASRFTSLLKMFGLTNRMVYSIEEVTEEVIVNPIDWNRVRDIKSQKKKESMFFLENSLNGK